MATLTRPPPQHGGAAPPPPSPSPPPPLLPPLHLRRKKKPPPVAGFWLRFQRKIPPGNIIVFRSAEFARKGLDHIRPLVEFAHYPIARCSADERMQGHLSRRPTAYGPLTYRQSVAQFNRLQAGKI